MGLLVAVFRHFLLILLIVLGAIGAAACAQEEGDDRRFDLPAQAAGPALNEFAAQADIVLIFPYDQVAGVHTRPMRGRFTIEAGLAHLLQGTGLWFRRGGDGTYLICADPDCAAERPVEEGAE